MKKDTRPTPTFTMQMPLELREPLAEMAEKRHLSLGMVQQGANAFLIRQHLDSFPTPQFFGATFG